MNIKQQNHYKWYVESESCDKWDYVVIHKQDGSWYCTCESFKYREAECKHIKAVKDGIELLKRDGGVY